jgi:outer membrane lipoprotein LolB
VTALRRVALAVALAGLAGCATMGGVHAPGDPVAWAARRTALTPLQAWQLDGRVAIAAGDEGYSGTLAWVQDGATLDFRFQGPLGFGGLRIHGDAVALTVTTSKGETFTVTDPEQDFEDRLGWSLPVHSMRYWMTGIPDPASPFEADYDAAGRPREIRQKGWTVRYDEFERDAPPATGGVVLPHRLTIERDDVRIKVVAGRWSF